MRLGAYECPFALFCNYEAVGLQTRQRAADGRPAGLILLRQLVFRREALAGRTGACHDLSTKCIDDAPVRELPLLNHNLILQAV